ncbi:ATP-binding cassette domain-containing protein [Bacillus testis]|uniref:ATP-binding cassette domain-containing protein n=1 Tax=Bacillus testis TaxID=1622072 RepID=UPI00067E9CCE|nr:ABC transporter ATP-binding protein [Bacillus testis]
MNEYAIQADSVSKKFDRTVILDDLSFKIQKNSKLAIIGHNGSGKSSLLKLIAGLYMPTSGSIQTFHQKMAYVPEHFPENIRFTLEEYLVLIGKIGGEELGAIKKKIAYYSDVFQLGPHLKSLLKHCSKGVKQKAGLTQALMTESDLLLLDEPLTGLDDESKTNFLQMMQKRDRDFTLAFTAHEQETVDLWANEQLVLKNGKMIKHESLTAQTAFRSIIAKIPARLNREDLKVFGCISADQGHIVEITVRSSESDECLAYLLGQQASILEVKEKKES